MVGWRTNLPLARVSGAPPYHIHAPPPGCDQHCGNRCWPPGHNPTGPSQATHAASNEDRKVNPLWVVPLGNILRTVARSVHMSLATTCGCPRAATTVTSFPSAAPREVLASGSRVPEARGFGAQLGATYLKQHPIPCAPARSRAHRSGQPRLTNRHPVSRDERVYTHRVPLYSERIPGMAMPLCGRRPAPHRRNAPTWHPDGSRKQSCKNCRHTPPERW